MNRKHDIREKIGKELLFFDGGMGSLLQEAGLGAGESPEDWLITHPDTIKDIHKAYLDAGADILTTCTFGANAIKQKDAGGHYSTKELVQTGIRLARRAIEETDRGGRPAYAALDTGSVGKLLQPLGKLSFEETVAAFRELFAAGEEADLIIIETMSDLYELKAAVIAAKEVSDLPIFASCILDEKGKLLTGGSVEAIIALLEGLGVDALGLNCGFGPAQMLPFVKEMVEKSSLPVLVNPNAGLPRSVQGETVYDLDPDTFAAQMEDIAACGPWVLGGCCGTTPAHIRALRQRVSGHKPAPVNDKGTTRLCSYTHAVTIGSPSTIIGEKINPTGNKPLAAALRENRMNDVVDLAIREKRAGAQVLDINVGLPDIDEESMLPQVVRHVQRVVNLPLVLDSSNVNALDKAARIYNGKPLINSVNGKQSSMDAVFPIVKKYGAAVIALTLDEDGIPKTAGGRVRIAEKIIREAARYGIPRKDVIIDTLAMTVSADSQAPRVCLSSLSLVREQLGVHTVLGVSNVSFGLPHRERINTAFYAMALAHGLSAAIINPFAEDMMATCHAARALLEQDENCTGYLAFCEAHPAPRKAASPHTTQEAPHTAKEKPRTHTAPAPQKAANTPKPPAAPASPLVEAICSGLQDRAAQATQDMLRDTDALTIINKHIVPALNQVGADFGSGAIFLPQLLMSAEAATTAFNILKEQMPAGSSRSKGTVLVSTVEGDIHDIGKNITRVLLESHDFTVIDLGKDIPCEEVVQKAKENNVKLIGLSALMTTTVPNMKKTIHLLKEAIPDCKVCVGGAVLTEEYAKEIDADYYCADAMATVRIAQDFFGSDQ